MGAIRGALLIFVAVLLFFSLFTLTLLLTLSSSLDYKNVERQSMTTVKTALNELSFSEGVNITEVVRQNYPMIQLYCMNNSNYLLNYQGFVVDIPCTTVSQGQDAIVDEWIKDSIHNIYYTEYSCSFIDCFSEYPVPLFLLSEYTCNFFRSKLFLSLLASLILFALVFFLVEKKVNAFILSGILLVVSSAPFVKLDYFLSLLQDKMIFQLLWIFFSQSFFVSIKLLLIGVGLIVFGILVDIFKIGIFFSNLISKKGKEEKEEKKEVKKEVRKSKKKSK